MADADFEEGEIKIIDEDAYICSDGELFRFERYNDTHINWTQIRDFDAEFNEQERLQQSYE